MSAVSIRVFGAVLLCAAAVALGQTAPSRQTLRAPTLQSAPPREQAALSPAQQLQIGIQLTRQAYLRQAIPHLQAARSAGLDPYVTGINLAICYLGTDQYQAVVDVLHGLHAAGARGAAVNNLLAQAYIGEAQPEAAYQAFLHAVAATPKDEKLYDYMADACTDRRDYSLGLRMVQRGLQELPLSARLHYEKAVFLGRLGSFEEAKPEFDRAAQLAPGSYIGYLAEVQKDLYEDDLKSADKVLHAAVASGHRDYRMLSLLGTVLLHEGAMPGQPQFAEAKSAIEESARKQPDYPATQIALGRICLMQGQAREAVVHLEIARRLEPEDPSVYAKLADAWEQAGNRTKAIQVRRQLGRLLAERTQSAAPSHR
jgi:predicted Zn-dependent protease